MGSRGRGRNTGREVNLHHTLRPQVHHNIVGTPESIDGSPIMTVLDKRISPTDTGKIVLMKNEKLCKHQRTSMSVMEKG